MQKIIRYSLLLFLFSCQTTIEEKVEYTQEQKPVPIKAVEEKYPETKKLELMPVLYYTYDSSSLSISARKKLQKNLLWMQENKNVKILVEGHCDERGTREYNLALGERRAYAVKRFLVNGGIKSSRIQVVSYGEERPAALGVGEGVYRYNRRTEIKIR